MATIPKWLQTGYSWFIKPVTQPATSLFNVQQSVRSGSVLQAPTAVSSYFKGIGTGTLITGAVIAYFLLKK